MKHILCYPLYNMWGCVFSVYPFPLWWLIEYIYFVLLSSSNRTYELLPIVYGKVMKQWYALYVYLYSYGFSFAIYTSIMLLTACPSSPVLSLVGWFYQYDSRYMLIYRYFTYDILIGTSPQQNKRRVINLYLYHLPLNTPTMKMTIC